MTHQRLVEHLRRLSATGFGYDLTLEDKQVLRDAADALTGQEGASIAEILSSFPADRHLAEMEREGLTKCISCGVSIATMRAARGQEGAAPSPQSTDEKNASGCVWSNDDQGCDSVWESQCKRDFYFDGAEGPVDAGFTVCPFCGGALSEARTSEHDGSDEA